MKMLGVLNVSRKWNFFKIINKCTRIKMRFTEKKLCTKVLDANTNVTKDVILFKYNNPRFFNLMNICAVCQFGFWTYLSVISFKTLRDTPALNKKESSWWEKINLGENKYRNGISTFSFLVGFGILSISWMYSLRTVKYLILRKGGKQITIVTYTPTMTNRIMTLDLADMSCKESREAAKSYLAIKLRGHYLHYLLDMKGEFRNPTLFDHTAGLRRNWK